MVLATIAATVLEFTRHFPDVMVFAKGSTPARTRLYQMGISANWNEIEPLLHVLGYKEDKGWQPFQKNTGFPKIYWGENNRYLYRWNPHIL